MSEHKSQKTRTRRQREWHKDKLSAAQQRVRNVASKLEGIAGLLKMTTAPDHRSILVGVGASLSDFEEELNSVITDLQVLEHHLRLE